MPGDSVTSLFELNEFVRRVIALNFKDLIWIRAEILQANFSRQHCYLDLVEKDVAKDAIIAQCSAVIWRTQLNKILQTYKSQLAELLQPGIEVKIQVQPEFDERYGFKLIIKDIDPQYTFGKMAMQRRQTLEALQKAGLLEKQKALRLSPVLQHIAVITSENAAGWQDFRSHLRNNIYQYAFYLSIFSASVQGLDAEKEISARIREINQLNTPFDAIVIIRGGGSKLDLSAFDGQQIAVAIAESAIPVLTGIGHDIDESIADIVAHQAFKTPTAVADFLVQHNADYEGFARNLFTQIQSISQLKVNFEQQRWQFFATGIREVTFRKLIQERHHLSVQRIKLSYQAKEIINTARQKLSLLSSGIEHLRPEYVLKRGYSLILKDGLIIKESTGVVTGDILQVQFYADEMQVKKT